MCSLTSHIFLIAAIICFAGEREQESSQEDADEDEIRQSSCFVMTAKLFHSLPMDVGGVFIGQ